MARVRTFRAWRYARPTTDITPLVSPPYDVIGESMRADFAAQDPYNVVELELPVGPLDAMSAGSRYENGHITWEAWRTAGVLAQDERPQLYVLEQHFTLDGREVRRRAFIAEVGLEPFDAGVVLPHERTLPKALGDRFELIKATSANFSQVFGLFDDPESESSALFKAAMAGDPIATATDPDGVTSTLWASPDPRHAEQLAALMSDKRIFIADGHHRYTTALAYRDMRRSLAEIAVPDPAYDYVMMALVNMDDPDLAVLPYNRIADGVDFDPDTFKTALAQHFNLSPLPKGHPSAVLDESARPSFLVKTKSDERPFLAVLREDVDPAEVITVEYSAAWKALDVAILQELVLWPLLGIHPDQPETLERISFTKNPHDAFAATADHDVAFVLRPTRLSQLRDVSLAGEMMPQKSTYFYPKLLSGLVFRSAD